jgi:hypothetical protein
MLDEIADYVRFADEAGFAGFGHPEHHLQVEGFEICGRAIVTTRSWQT